MAHKTRNRKYDIVDYNPAWAEMFTHEAQLIQSIFGQDALQIEHIGSTSVPGLAGKPTIDMLIIVDRVDGIDKYASGMEALGYQNFGAFIAPDTRMF